MTRLPGVRSTEGRRVLAGRGSGAGEARLGLLGRLASVGPEPMGRAERVSAAVVAVETFETWLGGWSDIR